MTVSNVAIFLPLFAYMSAILFPSTWAGGAFAFLPCDATCTIVSVCVAFIVFTSEIKKIF